LSEIESKIPEKDDAYISYIHRFFHLWLPVYDLFGYFIYPVYKKFVKIISPHQGLTVLDVCTGTGEIAIRLANKHAEVVGIDITEEMLNKAKKKSGTKEIKFLTMDARKLDFPDSSFDAVTISLALHDMPRKVRLQVIEEALRVSKERLLIVDYDFTNTGIFKTALIKLISLFETSYFKRFADEGVAPLLAELGLMPKAKRFSSMFFFAIFEIKKN
jgi:ubiquinone/menaquinone biosynthesis C-methylase UbiE